MRTRFNDFPLYFTIKKENIDVSEFVDIKAYLCNKTI